MEYTHEYSNLHVATIKKASAARSKLESEIAATKEFESVAFSKFLRQIRLGDKIHWIEIDDTEYEGTAITYLDQHGSNHGIRIALKYGTTDLTADKGPVVVKAWLVVE